MKNDSIFNRIPLPFMIAIWIGLVAVGAVLVYSVFFSGTGAADSTAQSAPKTTLTAQAAKATKPVATQAAAKPATQS